MGGFAWTTGLLELPPRARRILWGWCATVGFRGTTSAYAENTRRGGSSPPHRWNYLRVRGEYTYRKVTGTINQELPPCARRIHGGEHFGVVHDGTTSACAENTFCCSTTPFQQWNYLRVRGEYILLFDNTIPAVELPPRARRIPLICSGVSFLLGTTSACAENTKQRLFSKRMLGNYLRVRGEYTGPKPSAVK